MALFSVIQFGNNDFKRYNNEYRIVSAQSHFTRQMGRKRPNALARCESITITIVAPEVDDLTIYEWYAKSSSFDGRIVFNIPDYSEKSSEGLIRELYFENALCVSLSEKYDIRAKNKRLLTLKFEAEKVTSNDVVFKHL